MDTGDLCQHVINKPPAAFRREESEVADMAAAGGGGGNLEPDWGAVLGEGDPSPSQALLLRRSSSGTKKCMSGPMVSAKATVPTPS